jgi:guanylate kinase
MDAFYLFVAPPSKETLGDRLKGRGTETEEAVQSRLQAAIAEIQYAQQPNIYDAVVVNDELDRAYDVFKKIALGEAREADPMPAL